MKKSLTILMCLAGIGAAQDADFTLTSSVVTFVDKDNNTSTEVTTDNAAMSWGGDTEDDYNEWFVTCTLPKVTKTDAHWATITTGTDTSNSSGLTLSAKKGSVTLGKGQSNVLDSTLSLSFDTSHKLTFAYYGGKAYLGNVGNGSYIYYKTSTKYTMEDGASRAWLNSTETQIGATTIASLEGSGYTAADMAVLMMTGAAPTENGTGDKKYYICTSGTTTAWSDDVGYTVGDSGVVTSTATLPPNFKYYANQEEAEANKTKTLILNFGNAAEGKVHNLGGIDLYNGVMKKDGSALSGYPADDSNAAPRTYSYGMLQLTDNSAVRFEKSNGTTGNKEGEWSSIGGLFLGTGAKLELSERHLMVTGLPYTSLGAGAQINLSNDAMMCFGLYKGDTTWPEDYLLISTANGSESATITNTSQTAAALGTATAANVAFENVCIEVNGAAQKTVAAQMLNVSIKSGNNGNGELIITGGKLGNNGRAIREIAAGAYSENNGNGGVTLLNRGDEAVQLESLFIGNSNTLKAYKTDEKGERALVKIDAYYKESAELSSVNDLGYNGLIAYSGATLDADLELGTGSKTDAVILGSNLWKFAKGETEAGYGLNMSGNDVTLKQGIVLGSWLFSEDASDGDEILLFSNVGNLNLSGLIETATDVSVEDEIAASLYFSSDVSPNDSFGSVADPTGEKGNMTGWFIDYRLDEEDMLGDVYLTYKMGLTIPEPTTATMSLLALTALAARRRRR
ncbi:MAG: hypothetical protein E7033_02085 [Akkermansiaceae bacterium]|nr:hypothetical protein [Akkermansiaceae bacterium]